MKKFVLLFVGFDPVWENPSDPAAAKVKKEWGDWFQSIGKSIVDSGNPFGPGKEVTKAAVKDLPHGASATVGYTIINAKDMDAAVKIAQSAPIITSVRVYEAMSM